MRKPTVITQCVANQFTGPNERIIEFSDRETDGPIGGLISFRRHEGRLLVRVYHCDPEVDVIVINRDADPAIPGSTVVLTTYNCEVILTPAGFFVRCTAPGCTYVSKITPAKHVARRWANAHDEDQPNDGRES